MPRPDPLIADLVARLGAAHVLAPEEAPGLGRDWTGHYHWRPRAVIRPAGRQEVADALRLCAAAGAGVVPVGGNTGLNGGTAAEGQVMLSLERMAAIRAVNPAARTITAEAGVVLSRLHEAAAAEGLAFPLTFGARGSAQVGGFLSTNAGGSNVLRYGSTRGLCLGVEVVLADGRMLDLMTALHKDNTGYALRELFIGAEGTLGIITAAVLRLVPAPRTHATAVAALPDLATALALLGQLQAATGGAVEAAEFLPDRYWRRMAAARPDIRPPFADPHPVTLMLELGSTTPEDADPRPDGSLPLVALLEDVLAMAMARGEVRDAVIARSEAQRRAIWESREMAAEITFARTPHVDTDISLPLDRMQAFLDRMAARLASLDPEADWLAIAHLGDGNFHYTAYPSTDAPAHLAAIRHAVAAETVALGGSFSAEHGIGLSKVATMRDHKDAVALDVMRSIKAALDPAGLLNRGKVLPDGKPDAGPGGAPA